MLVVSIGGSPSLRSRSGVLLERSRQWLQDRGVEVVTFQVRDFPPKTCCMPVSTARMCNTFNSW